MISQSDVTGRNCYIGFKFRMSCQYREMLLLSGLIVAALVIRLYRMGEYSLWADEASSLDAGINKVYFHPPLFSFLSVAWAKWAETEFSLRLLATIFSIGAVIVTWFLAKRILNSIQGTFWATLFIVISPSQVYYGREFRMYSLLTFVTALSWITFLNWMRKGTLSQLILAVLVGSSITYTHNFGIIFLASQSLSVLTMHPRMKAFARLVKYYLLILLLYLPYIYYLFYFFKRFLGSKYWAEAITWKTPFYLLRFFTSGLEPPYRISAIMIILGSGLFILGLVFSKNRELGLLAKFGFFVPIVTVIILSILLPFSVLVARYLIFAAIPFAIVMGAGVEILTRWRPAVILPVTLIAFQFWSITLQYRNIFLAPAIEVRERKEFRESCRLILDLCQDGDFIGTTCMSGTHPVWYYITYRSGFPPTRMVDIDGIHLEHLGVKYNANDFLEHSYTIALPINIDELLRNHDYKRFWFFGTQWSFEDHPDDFYFNQRIRIRNWLTARYPQIGSWQFKGVDLRLFDLENPLHPGDTELNDELN